MRRHFANITRMLLKKPLAFAGMCFIILCCLIAIFAYQLAPDNTPNADLQTVEIQAKPPGFKQMFLITRSATIHQSGYSIFSGKQNPYTWIPITNFVVGKEGITVKRYIDEDTANIQFFKN